MEDVTEVTHVVANGERDSSDYVKKLKVPLRPVPPASDLVY